MALLALGGCASSPVEHSEPRGVELVDTPFFPQRLHHCGPAALATVLAGSGVAVDPQALAERVYLPARRGSLQLELIAATRSHDRLAYLIEPTLPALLDEVAAGRPVLVLQNLGLKRFPAWHYAVVIGFEAGGARLILRSGVTERLLLSARKFERTWSRAGRWGIVTLTPDELPARPEPRRYLAAVAGLETAGRYPAARSAYHTALSRWPEEATALLGVGNAHYRLGELAAAARAYRALLERHPRQVAGRNNLAQVLLEQGEVHAAWEEIRAARALLDEEHFADELADTEAQIRAALSR